MRNPLESRNRACGLENARLRTHDQGPGQFQDNHTTELKQLGWNLVIMIRGFGGDVSAYLAD